MYVGDCPGSENSCSSGCMMILPASGLVYLASSNVMHAAGVIKPRRSPRWLVNGDGNSIPILRIFVFTAPVASAVPTTLAAATVAWLVCCEAGTTFLKNEVIYPPNMLFLAWSCSIGPTIPSSKSVGSIPAIGTLYVSFRSWNVRHATSKD